MLVVFALLFWQATFEVGKIDVEGLSRFKSDAVVSTIGLKPGSNAGKVEFEAACQRLIHTGLFESCNWKYVPTSQTAVALALQVREAPADQTVRLTIPGVSDAELWQWLRANEPLVQPKMPASDEAAQFYTAAIRRFLKKDVNSSIDTNLQTHETTLVFRPVDLAKIESVKFEGAQAISAAALEAKLNPLAGGMAFTEYDVKRLLDVNIRPMYEELGRLNVSFSGIKIEGSTVTVHVNEGRVYTLGQIKTTGIDAQPAMPAGEVANWRKVTGALETSLKNLRNQGYLEAKYTVKRDFNEGKVDVAADFVRGPQFVFAALKLDGLNAGQESAVRSVWTLKKGAPMNESYVDDFIRAAFGKLGSEFSGVASQLEPSGPNMVDVIITFRRR